MYDFIIAAGHTSSGNIGCGAVDSLDESNCTREIAPLVTSYLEKEGKSVGATLRIDEGNSYNCEDCYTRAEQANNIGAEWYVEIHLNAGIEHRGDGSEVCICSSNPDVQNMAERVSESVANSLGINNRGAKSENLIVLRRTAMKSILVECMFVDSDNPSRYNADVIAKAIAEGLLGYSITSKPSLGWNKSADGTKWWYCTDIENYYYYISSWQKIGDFWYLFDSVGYCITGWVHYQTYKDKKDVWYYLDPIDCNMAVGWKQVNDDWYYFDTNGEMQTGWIKDNEKYYYLYSNGTMTKNCDIYGYHFNEHGEATKL